MEYPKINTLYKREGCGPFDEGKGRYVSDVLKKPRHSPIIEGVFSCPEFDSIRYWTVTEKVDGTNIRIIWDSTAGIHNLKIRGRSEESMIPVPLLEYLQKTFTYEKMAKHFPSSNVVLFGEGYGPKIQNGGYYRKDVSFIMFDAFISGYWLERDDIQNIAQVLDIQHVDKLFVPSSDGVEYVWTRQEIVDFVKSRPESPIAEEKHDMEGIIARSYPLLLFRNSKNPIMFKLKCKDFML